MYLLLNLVLFIMIFGVVAAAVTLGLAVRHSAASRLCKQSTVGGRRRIGAQFATFDHSGVNLSGNYCPGNCD